MKQLSARYCLTRLMRAGATYREITSRAGVAPNTISKIIKGGVVREKTRVKLYDAMVAYLAERKESAEAEVGKLRSIDGKENAS